MQPKQHFIFEGSHKEPLYHLSHAYGSHRLYEIVSLQTDLPFY